MLSNRLTATFLAAALLCSLPALGATEQRIEAYLIDEGKHPEAFQHAFVVPNDSDGDVYFCFGYANDFKRKGEEGSFKGKATITRFDPDTGEGTEEVLRKQGNLSKNKWLRCVHTGPVRQGDMVVAEYEMNDLPKPRGGTMHVKSSLGQERMLIRELRGAEAKIDIGEPRDVHHRSSSIVIENGKHKKVWQQAWVVDTDNLDPIQFCFGYGNNFKKGNKGKVVATAEITRADPDTGETATEEIEQKGKLKDNQFKKCVEIEGVRLGDSVVTEYKFKGFPRLRGNERTAAKAQAAGGDAFMVKTGMGPIELANVELLSPNTGGGANPGTDPDTEPTPNATISAADQTAASALLIKSKKTQLWRFKNDQPKHWTVIGPKTTLGSGLGGVNPATAGYGDTIAQAVADYEKKMGKLPAGGSLSASDVASLEWYSEMKTAGGPTSIRRDAAGAYHGEYFRPGAGSGIHKSGLKGITGCVEWFKAQGL